MTDTDTFLYANLTAYGVIKHTTFIARAEFK